MPRFVILEHDHPTLHWDLMLESGDVLRTWRLAQLPAKPGDAIDALALPDHRLAYLDYEGPVSGDRGTVKRWDAGEFEMLSSSDADGPRVRLHGSRIQGVINVVRRPECRLIFESAEI